jgi:hypothetical protein
MTPKEVCIARIPHEDTGLPTTRPESLKTCKTCKACKTPTAEIGKM